MKRDKEGEKYTFIIFLVVVAVLIYGWHTSEKKRLSLLEDLNAANEQIEHLEWEIQDLKDLMSCYDIY